MLAHFERIDVDARDPRSAREFTELITDLRNCQSGADGEHEIAVLKDEIRGALPVNSGAAENERMIRIDQVDAGPGYESGNFQPIQKRRDEIDTAGEAD